MAIDSTAELLFNISADRATAIAATAEFREMMTEDLGSIADSFDTFTADAVQCQENLAASLLRTVMAEDDQSAATERLAQAHGHAVSEIQATSGALRVLEGSGGIRAAERFIATSLGIGPALQAIFPIVGAVAFGQVLLRLGENVVEFYKKWDPLSQAEKRAADGAKALDDEIQRIGEDLRKLDFEALTKAIGKPAADLAAAQQLISTKISGDKVMIGGLLTQIADAQKAVKEGTVTSIFGTHLSEEASPDFSHCVPEPENRSRQGSVARIFGSDEKT